MRKASQSSPNMASRQIGTAAGRSSTSKYAVGRAISPRPRAIGTTAEGGRAPFRAASSYLEQAPDLHRQPHVALQLELARHERHLAGQLAADHVEPVLRRHAQGEV